MLALDSSIAPAARLFAPPWALKKVLVARMGSTSALYGRILVPHTPVACIIRSLFHFTFLQTRFFQTLWGEIGRPGLESEAPKVQFLIFMKSANFVIFDADYPIRCGIKFPRFLR